MPRRALIAVLATALALAAAGPAAAAPPFPSKIQLPSGWAPEGITAGAGTTIYVGSLAGGAVWAGDVRTGEGDVLVPPWGGAAVGVEYEADANRLWVAGGPTGTVRVYDATSGDLLRAYTFGPAGAVFLNDLVVTDDAVYVTDSLNPWLDVIPLGPDDALPAVGDVTTLPLDGITFEAGIQRQRDRRRTRLADRRRLVHRRAVPGRSRDRRRHRDLDRRRQRGPNGDGLELRGSTLYVVRNRDHLIEVFRLGPGLASAVPLGTLPPAGFPPELLSVPTTAAVQAGRLWVVNARFGITTTDYWVTQLPTNP